MSRDQASSPPILRAPLPDLDGRDPPDRARPVAVLQEIARALGRAAAREHARQRGQARMGGVLLAFLAAAALALCALAWSLP
jgi:cobalamin biosynthesis protein CobD/CbiB